MEVNKDKLKEEVLRVLEEQVKVLRKAVEVASEATTHPDAKAEGKYDTRAIETGYLAGAQAARLVELESKVRYLRHLKFKTFQAEDEISETALVQLGDKWYLILPKVGGLAFRFLNLDILSITPESNLGERLLDSVVGDVVDDKSVSALL